MNTNTALSLIGLKIIELESAIDHLQVAAISDNTRRTQTFQKKHELHNLLIMQDLLNNLKRNKVEEVFDHEKIAEWFTSATTLTVERKAKYILNVKEGDKIMDLLQEHKDMKDVWGKIQKSMDEQGLHIEDGVIVR